MAKTTKSNSKKSSTSGKKGGASMITPEVVGAVTGAAIGGVAGLMLANQKTRDSLAVVKDKAVGTAGDIFDNVQIETSGAKEDVKKNINQVSSVADDKINKSLPKK